MHHNLRQQNSRRRQMFALFSAQKPNFKNTCGAEISPYLHSRGSFGVRIAQIKGSIAVAYAKKA